MTEQPKQNTDRELWRESDDRSQCTPSIHVTEHGGIGINVGGLVIVMPIRNWHELAVIADLKAAGIDMTEPKKRLHEMIDKAKANHIVDANKMVDAAREMGGGGIETVPSTPGNNMLCEESTPPANPETAIEALMQSCQPIPGEAKVKRFDASPLSRPHRTVEVVTAADHDAAIAEQAVLFSEITKVALKQRQRAERAEAEITELREQQLTLARDYDPNCDEFDFAYQREVMKSAFRIIEAAQSMAQSLGRDPEGCLVTACECVAEVIDDRDMLKEELKDERQRAERAEVTMLESRHHINAIAAELFDLPRDARKCYMPGELPGMVRELRKGLAEAMERAKQEEAELVKVNAFARTFGYGQGQLDGELTKCIEEAFDNMQERLKQSETKRRELVELLQTASLVCSRARRCINTPLPTIAGTVIQDIDSFLESLSALADDAKVGDE